MLVAGLSRVTIRASLDVPLGRMKSFGGFDVDGGSGFVVDGDGSGMDSFGAGLERVALAILSIMVGIYGYISIETLYNTPIDYCMT